MTEALASLILLFGTAAAIGWASNAVIEWRARRIAERYGDEY
jgi:hypothetical protein